ncbi:MAG: hypothetical protein QOK36_321 [Gaiellales bacterium]|jgi:hypothetical protein|nr:hypothetical protein [Gaiellales bacterium]
MAPDPFVARDYSLLLEPVPHLIDVSSRDNYPFV